MPVELDKWVTNLQKKGKRRTVSTGSIFLERNYKGTSSSTNSPSIFDSDT
ncbi:MAG: hypothetical protein GF308_14620 [Candidatus Heimdallarchaeota archaeon]|nr:hypothetical protein [Candidatus Heimdallarchaeota archaeon]